MTKRDLTGYGPTPIHPQWPNQARIAINFVINYEEGAESNILHGDSQSEHYLTDLPGISSLLYQLSVTYPANPCLNMAHVAASGVC
ncbi:putative urate catabolism protein [Piscirickettsia salmonis]|uniref:Polysaccharide deacetylase family protein n=1 Tax=Piscirickettsia salmonis TaxID=1238 RepID=A0AAC8ZPV1_PISSA|nr:hypothetical protein [Piscirickettsia salmonis]ALB23940.1 polysaccharide deacetylase family protein [Piscirickettsia salmonis]ALT18688.1 hypothetical protein PSLF89_07595 [Piscirickettsia salmonis LF-89 = ATCC VR-1361]ALY03764.1 hypothetical protein AWE47_13595 [Piscirickettsia salmonis]AMA43326.1 hypothetical protein AWJ11_13820 [Piscirickettsia salmonis]AOS35796.1 hypothetical protein AVM72_10935 [Piscirickettsia salmonis]